MFKVDLSPFAWFLQAVWKVKAGRRLAGNGVAESIFRNKVTSSTVTAPDKAITI